MDSFSNSFIRLKIFNFISILGAGVPLTVCRRHVIAFKWPMLPLPPKNPGGSYGISVPSADIEINFWNPFLRKIAFWTKNEEKFEDFDRNSLYKIVIFQICMKYFLDLSLLQRYKTLEDNQFFQQFFWFLGGGNIRAFPLSTLLKWNIINTRLHKTFLCELFWKD